MKRVLITIGAVVILSLTGLTVMTLSPATSENPSKNSVQVNEQTQIFAIENMTCPACPFTVKKAMARVEGVTSVTVDFAAKTATALFSPTVTTAQEIAAASTGVGYPATPIEK
jgi:periplasmic mercuric ion binding protein